MFPKELPKDAVSFRIGINNKYGTRMVITEWYGRYRWTPRLVEDFFPTLALAGGLDFIACNEPPRGAADASRFWHWSKGEWVLVADRSE